MDRYVQKLDMFPGGCVAKKGRSRSGGSTTVSGGVWYARRDFNKYTILRRGTIGPRIALVHRRTDADLFVVAKQLRACLERAVNALRSSVPQEEKNRIISEATVIVDKSNGLGVSYMDDTPAEVIRPNKLPEGTVIGEVDR